jgi:hypothetical protein
MNSVQKVGSGTSNLSNNAISKKTRTKDEKPVFAPFGFGTSDILHSTQHRSAIKGESLSCGEIEFVEPLFVHVKQKLALLVGERPLTL